MKLLTRTPAYLAKSARFAVAERLCRNATQRQIGGQAKIMRRVIRAKYLDKPIGDVSNLENPSAVDEISKAK